MRARCYGHNLGWRDCPTYLKCWYCGTLASLARFIERRIPAFTKGPVHERR